MVFTKNGTLFSPNSGEDQKKGLRQKWNTFFPWIQVDTYAQMYTRIKLLGGCRCRPDSNYWGGYSQIIGKIYPPRVSAPLAQGPEYFGDFRNIFLPNIGEDQKSRTIWALGP